MNKNFIGLAMIGLVCLIFVISCSKECINKEQNAEIKHFIPTTAHTPEAINSFSPQRVSDLTLIAIALEKYKQKNRSYPISSTHRKWDYAFDEGGEVNLYWIDGLAPDFLPSLPRDPRLNNIRDNQYLYRSDGANYKLIATLPEDCEYVKSKVPQMIDPRRGCKAYGFWTKGAVGW